MNKPKINLSGKIIEMPKPTAAIWRKVMEFHPTRNDVMLADLVDDYGAIIALAFGISKDELIDNIDIEDILPAYDDVITYLMNLVVSKFGNNKKNKVETQV